MNDSIIYRVTQDMGELSKHGLPSIVGSTIRNLNEVFPSGVSTVNFCKANMDADLISGKDLNSSK